MIAEVGFMINNMTGSSEKCKGQKGYFGVDWASNMKHISFTVLIFLYFAP